MTERPVVLKGKTTKYKTNCGNLYLTLNDFPGDGLGEIRIEMGKSGHCVNVHQTLIGILISIILQLQPDKEKRIKLFKKHLVGVNCGETFVLDDTQYKSCLDLVSRECIKELSDGAKQV